MIIFIMGILCTFYRHQMGWLWIAMINYQYLIVVHERSIVCLFLSCIYNVFHVDLCQLAQERFLQDPRVPM